MERDLSELPIRHTVFALHQVTTLLMANHDDAAVEPYREALTEAHDGLRAVLDRLPAPDPAGIPVFDRSRSSL